MTGPGIPIALIAGAVLLVRLADLVAVPCPTVLALAGLAASVIPGVAGSCRCLSSTSCGGNLT